MSSQYNGGLGQALSPPDIELQWMGWTASAIKMQRAGWQFSLEDNMMHQQKRFAFRHPQLQAGGITAWLPIEAMRDQIISGYPVPAVVNCFSHSIEIISTQKPGFRPVALSDPYEMDEPFFTRDADMLFSKKGSSKFFQPIPLNDTETIVYTEENQKTVSELLAEIVNMQSEDSYKYHEEQVRRKKTMVNEERAVTAQIIKLAV